MDELLLATFWASAIRLSAPMLIAALGEIVVQRSGMFNIAIEGMMLIGAFVGVAAGLAFGSTLAGVVASAVVVGCIGLLYGVVVAACRADQIVAGIGFNIVAIGGTSLLRSEYLSEGRTVDAGNMGTFAVPWVSDLPFVGAVLFDQSPLVYFGYVMAALLTYYLYRTRSGLRLRAVGERAAAADASGIRVTGVRILAMGFGGLMAGVAGAYLSLIATGGAFLDEMTHGRGFLALAIVIFGRWHPVSAVLAAILFGAAEALQFRGQAILGEWVSPPLLMMSPFVLALLAWAVVGKGKYPSDLGVPFIRAKRH